MSESTSDFDTWYDRINWYKGEWAGREAHDKVSEFWTNSGRAGAEYLAMRLRDEWHLDLLEGVSSLLGLLAPDSVEPILDALDQPMQRGHHEYFLKALRWTDEEQDGERVETTIRKFMQSDDGDTRAAAYGATAILPRDKAIEMLTPHFLAEDDEYAREVLDEEMRDAFLRKGRGE